MPDRDRPAGLSEGTRGDDEKAEAAWEVYREAERLEGGERLAFLAGWKAAMKGVKR